MLQAEMHEIRNVNLDPSKPWALEADLIRRAISGQGEAFCELVRPCQRAVFMTAFAILQNQQDAEDASQEAVLKAFIALQIPR